MSNFPISPDRASAEKAFAEMTEASRTAMPSFIVTFNTGEFEFSHGHKPRGDGAWAFAYRADADLSEIFWINGFFSDVKAIARKKATAEGHRQVYVCP